MDILDLFNGAGNPGNRKNTMISAPIELMSEFLINITSEQYDEALRLSHSILVYEPSNKIVLEYRDFLQRIISEKELEKSDSGSVSSDSSERSDDDSEIESDDESDSESDREDS